MQEFKLVMEKASGELEEILVPEGTTFEEIAKSYQEDYKDLIVLACVDGKLRELNKEIKKDCSVKFLTSISRDGKRTYRRSMTLLMQKAIENLWGEQAHVRLLYSLGEGYYCRMEDGTDATKLAQIKAEMLRLVHENLPIRKCSVKTGDAERIFREKGMKDKERLLHYRRSSRVNIYELEMEGLKVLNLNDSKYHILNWLAILADNRTYWQNGSIAEEAKKYIKEHFLIDITPYDIVVGYRADDSYFSFAQDFVSGVISLEKLSEAMRLGKLGEQIVLKSPKAFETIYFQNYENVDAEIYYIKKAEREREARREYRRRKKESADIHELFMLDIMREGMENGDTRLFR